MGHKSAVAYAVDQYTIIFTTIIPFPTSISISETIHPIQVLNFHCSAGLGGQRVGEKQGRQQERVSFSVRGGYKVG